MLFNLLCIILDASKIKIMKRLIKNFSFVVLSFLLMCGGYAFSQQINGNIQDEDSNPIPGVTVVVEGSQIGTTSDFDGNFSIDASEGDSLIFSFIGFRHKQFL